MSGQAVIISDFGSVKIDILACLIGIILFQQCTDHLDELVDAARRGLNDVRALDPELGAVIEEGFCIELRDLHDGLVLALRAFEHLVLAGVPVAGQMSDIRDIHDARHVISGIAKVFLENILHDVAAEIADMRVMVHSRSAGVHLDLRRIIRDEFFDSFGKRIIDPHNL